MISSGTPIFWFELTSGYVRSYPATSGGVLMTDTKDPGNVGRARLVSFHPERVSKITLARGSNLNERCYSSEVGYHEWNGTKYACEAGPLTRFSGSLQGRG